MDSLFDYAQACLHSTDIEDKLCWTHEAYARAKQKQLRISGEAPVYPIALVKFPDRPILLAPRNMAKRNIKTQEGRAAFFHAIAHVEFVAIYLAWDIIYRFRGLPESFYLDWLRVADEEAQHFSLLSQHLLALGVSYGDLPAHSGLWEHATDTADNLLARLAMVPRCMEARGLDVTPALINKFIQLNDGHSAAILTRILADEVGHVERGSYWFKAICQQQGQDSEATFQHLIRQYYRGGKPKGPFNREMRIIAGFSNAELDWLEIE
ncbi:MAG: ferritin-like domain-containing protein [Methylococcaceae bacterium]|jgi:uncharacterized ferritin-like protein (DUF455 family)